jgi:hypothetical protein
MKKLILERQAMSKSHKEKMINPSLNDLATFAPMNESEILINKETVIQEYLADTKSSWSSGKYWLGGQFEVRPDEPITPTLLSKADKLVQAASLDYCCNSAEMASVWRAQRQFAEINTIVQRHNDIQKKRMIMGELNKTKLNSDVNGMIVSLL